MDLAEVAPDRRLLGRVLDTIDAAFQDHIGSFQNLGRDRAMVVFKQGRGGSIFPV